MRKFLIFTSVLALVVSCRQSEAPSRQTIQFVRDVISNPDSYESRVVSGKVPDRKNTIFLIGEAEECECFTNELMLCDRHDNVDGSHNPDFLPDFAGETIISLVDMANTPYSGYLDWRNEDYLRELTVKSVISALDTVCSVSPYDLENRGKQPLPKLIVLTSSYNAEYGLYDVDSLFTATRCGIPVINPLDRMMDAAVDVGASNIGVIATEKMIASGIYSAVFQRKARGKGLGNPECVAFAVSDTLNPLREFLDKYIKAGYSKPLDAVLIDDLSVSSDSLKAEQAMLTSVLNVESLTYSKLISPETSLIDSRKVTSEAAFRIFRDLNLFSHAIRYPDSNKFLLVPAVGLPEQYYLPDGYFTDEFKYSRQAASGVNSTVLIEYRDRFLPSE